MSTALVERNHHAIVPAAAETVEAPVVLGPAPAAARYSIDDLDFMARHVAASRLFPEIQNASAAFALMLRCQAEGIHPGLATATFHVIEGKPSMRADAMHARFLQAGGRVKWGETTAEVCEATFVHPDFAPDGFPVRITFAELDKAGVTRGKDGLKANWKRFPRSMLRARCISEGIRAVHPGIVAGIYTPEEVQDFDDPPPPKAVAVANTAAPKPQWREIPPPKPRAKAADLIPASADGPMNATELDERLARDCEQNGLDFDAAKATVRDHLKSRGVTQRTRIVNEECLLAWRHYEGWRDAALKAWDEELDREPVKVGETPAGEVIDDGIGHE